MILYFDRLTSNDIHVTCCIIKRRNSIACGMLNDEIVTLGRIVSLTVSIVDS
jgi:hypothetical protein